jgi:large conductance mechanosensitive channel
VLGWGQFLTVVINFVILAFIIFMIVRSANRMKRKQEDAAPAPDPEEVLLLREIRDSLKKG